MPDVIEISESSSLRCLSNHSITPFRDSNGILFNSAIQAYYYHMLYEKPNMQRSIRSAKSLEEIIHIISYETYNNMSKPLQHNLKYNIEITGNNLYYILLHKLSDNPICVDALLSTWGKRILVVERHDAVLGCGKARTGLNLTGEILMELREHFRIIRQNQNRQAMIKAYMPFKLQYVAPEDVISEEVA